MNDTFKYRGRNSFTPKLPDRLQIRSFAEPPIHAPYPVRVYDGEGNLKYEITREQLLDKQYKKILAGYLKDRKV